MNLELGGMGDNKQRRMIMVVDDEPDLCEIMSFDLKDAGYETITANGAYEAIKMLGEKTVDAILSDIRMPQGSGVELLSHVKNSSARRPVVMLLSAFSDFTVIDAYDGGAEFTTSKPINITEVLNILGSCLAPPDERWPTTMVGDNVALSQDFNDLHAAQNDHQLSIGRGGFFMASPNVAKLKIGDQVEFRFRFQTGPISLLEGTGKIRWVRRDSKQAGDLPPGVGVEFVGLSAACRRVVLPFLSSRSVVPYIPRS